MDGVINIYKTSGMTSFDVVSSIRKISGTKKVGHTGTLDPLAEGVLPVCLGKATKLVDYIMNDFKVYRTVLKLGVISDTYDREGKIINTSSVDVSEAAVKDAILSFLGSIAQVPPMYSALKKDGKKLYELARQGIEVEREPRNITIYELNITNIALPYVSFTVKCSKGTYIRSLCYDIGNKLKCGAIMWDLERIATGNFTKENAVLLKDLSFENIKDYLIPMDEALHMYDKIYLNNTLEKLLVNGVCIQNQRLLPKLKTDILYRVYLENRKFIGIGTVIDNGFKIIKLLT